MKFLPFITALLFVCNVISQTNNGEGEALIPDNKNNINGFTGNYDNPLFANYNLSGNTAPQNEPSIRISRVNPNYVVAAWRDFRLGYTDTNIVRRIGYTYSTNGGVTWAASQILPDPNPAHTSQSDPVLTTDSQGYFYLSSTSRQPVTGYNRDMLLYRSTNNGQTFQLYSTAVPGTGGAGEDKEWIFCDPVNTNSTYNNIFISWTSFGPQPGIKFRKSTNGGLNWSATVNIGDNTSGQGSNICSGTGGQIYVVWASGGIKFDKSTNGGTSFGTDYSLTTVATTNGFPFICCDYSNNSTRGNVYVIWDDMRGGNSDVYIQRSTNGGANWLASPVRVNDVTTNNQYWPVIQCDNNGNLYAMYYDNRGGSSQVNTYLAYSTDAGTTWVNQLLSDSTFAAVPVGGTGGDVRYGDYIGIDAYNGKVIPVWTDDRKGTPNQEIYASVITGLISVNVLSTEVPDAFKLYQNYPNPFNPVTHISFDIKTSGNVKLTLYDVLGKEVKVMVDKQLNPGSYFTELNAEDLPSGVYFYTLRSENYYETKSLVILK